MSNTNISTTVGTIHDRDQLVSPEKDAAAQLNIDWDRIQHEQPTINIGTLGKCTVIRIPFSIKQF